MAVRRAYAFVAMYPRKLGDMTRMFSSFTGVISMEYPERRRQSFESESRSTSTEGQSNLSKDSLEPRISSDLSISWSAILEMPATRTYVPRDLPSDSMKYGVSLPGLMSTTMMFLSSTVTLKMSGEIMGLHEDEMEFAMESIVLNRISSGMPMTDLSSRSCILAVHEVCT